MKISKIIEKYHYKAIALLFMVLYTIGYLLVLYDEDKRIKHHLIDKMENTYIQYKLIYNNYKKNSRAIYFNINRNRELLNIYSNLDATNMDASRKRLYEIMKPIYKNAKKFGVKQLHFHLKNSDSFLRMHKPSKFGDNLLNIRHSVRYVNKYHKAISGFEQGRILHGFRYVYPIKSKKGEHLGSVEVSIDTKAFEEMFENTLFVNAKFIIDKKLSKKKVFEDELKKYYVDSLESHLFLEGKNEEVRDELLPLFTQKKLQKYQKKLQKKFESKKAFSIEVCTKNGSYIKSFIPIKNIKEKRVVAYFISLNRSVYLDNLHKDSLIIKIALFFLTLLIAYIIHRNINYSASLRRDIDKKTQELEESQEKIVQAQKMASLGMLVAGVAHEINTPVGLSITAISHLIDETKTLKLDYEKQTMDESEFQRYLENTTKTADIIFKNLIRSAELVKNFKQLSINQNLTELSTINLKYYVDNLLLSLDKKIRDACVEIESSIESSIEFTTYHDVVSQIFSNFILNSLTHAFADVKSPKIKIDIKKKNDTIFINYSDNGIGMDRGELEKLFDPFYTTNRGAGNSGLGMHIIYNLIVDKLEGSIDVSSQINQGVSYRVTLPIVGK